MEIHLGFQSRKANNFNWIGHLFNDLTYDCMFYDAMPNSLTHQSRGDFSDRATLRYNPAGLHSLTFEHENTHLQLGVWDDSTLVSQCAQSEGNSANIRVPCDHQIFLMRGPVTGDLLLELSVPKERIPAEMEPQLFTSSIDSDLKVMSYGRCVINQTVRANSNRGSWPLDFLKVIEQFDTSEKKDLTHAASAISLFSSDSDGWIDWLGNIDVKKDDSEGEVQSLYSLSPNLEYQMATTTTTTPTSNLFRLLSQREISGTSAANGEVNQEDAAEIKREIEFMFKSEEALEYSVDAENRNILHYAAMTLDPLLIDTIYKRVFSTQTVTLFKDASRRQVDKEVSEFSDHDLKAMDKRDIKNKKKRDREILENGNQLDERLKIFSILINSQDREGNTPAHLFFKSIDRLNLIPENSSQNPSSEYSNAIRESVDQFFKLLVLTKAHLDVINGNGDTPLYLFFRTNYVPFRWRGIFDQFLLPPLNSAIKNADLIQSQSQKFIEALQNAKAKHLASFPIRSDGDILNNGVNGKSSKLGVRKVKDGGDKTPWDFILNEYDDAIKAVRDYTQPGVIELNEELRKAPIPLTWRALDWDRGGPMSLGEKRRKLYGEATTKAQAREFEEQVSWGRDNLNLSLECNREYLKLEY